MLTAVRSHLRDIVTRSGWRLKIESVETEKGPRYDAHLTSPEGAQVYALAFWPDVPRVSESISGYLKAIGDHGAAAHVRRKLAARDRS